MRQKLSSYQYCHKKDEKYNKQITSVSCKRYLKGEVMTVKELEAGVAVAKG